MKYNGLHAIVGAVALAVAAGAAAGGRGNAPDWDRDAAARKAAYVYIDAMVDVSDERYTDYTSKLHRAVQLDPADADIAADYAELLLQTTELDSAGLESAYEALYRRFDKDRSDWANAAATAELAQRLGRYDDVATVWKALQKALPGRNDPSMNLADTYVLMYMRGDSAAYDSAMTIYSRLEEGLGFDIGLSSHKIRALALRKDTAAVMDELQRITLAAPADADVALYAGQMYENFGRPDSAMARYEHVAALDSTDGRALMLRAQLHLSQGDSAAYDAEVFRALESHNLDFQNKMRMLTGYIRALFTDSTQHARIDRLFDVMRQVNPGEPQLHALNALYLAQTGRPDSAAEQAGYAVDLDPDNAELWSMLVQMQAAREGTAADEGVVDAARRGARHFPESLYFPIVGAGRLAILKRYDEASAMLDSFDISAMDNPEAASDYWSMKGDIEYGRGNTDSSAVMYERAIAINPHNYMSMNNFAYHLAVADSLLDRAEHYSALAVKNDPQNATYLDTYAWVLFRKGEYTLARQYIDAVLRIFKEQDDKAAEEGLEATGASPEVLDHAGDIYFMTGARKEALEYWRRAHELEPDNALIKRKVDNKTIFFE
ncbi:MAG: hypothetical protein K2L27_00900 [Muribaculaceae bacterium]|nr:hypothetical protein [Muribaculaceae bacterium]